MPEFSSIFDEHRPEEKSKRISSKSLRKYWLSNPQAQTCNRMHESSKDYIENSIYEDSIGAVMK